MRLTSPRRTLILLTSATLLLAGAGCSRFKPAPSDHFVYVTAKQANLRDRVAAVSNRTGQVENGEKLKVLDHARHWVKVQTPKGEVGWVEEKMIATQDTEADFNKLAEDHKNDPAVAGAVVRDQVYMHAKPGRDTEHFYLLPEGEKLKLLRRATLIKTTLNPATVARAQRAIPQAVGSNAALKPGAPLAIPPTPTGEPALAPQMEDWWLVRDSQGHTGWLFARMMDVDAPEALTRYAEGQRFVGAYILTTVHDDAAPNGPADIPVYVTVLSPYKAGLPYDFDQVRVFTWSLSHHRYETGFREKNIEGYLPVTVGKSKDPYAKGTLAQEELPSFTYKLLTADAPPVVPDPVTGVMLPTKTISKTFRLEGNLVHRIAPPGSSAFEDLAHPVYEDKKDKKKKGKK